jgi:hypothetical protein
MSEADSTTTNVRRIYEGDVSADGEFDMEAIIAFPDPASQAKWGWKQDGSGRWYREVPEGKSVFEEPKRDQ